MTDTMKNKAAGHTRRSVLLQGVACATAATAMIAVNMNEAKAAKLPQKSVNYQLKPKGAQQCDNCSLFEKPSSCKSVAGTISPNGWCSIYRKA